MTTLALIAASTLLALAQDAEKKIPATPIRPAPATAAPQAAATPTLGVGDRAPALKYDEWIKGDKIDAIAPGKVHVIEFWATWCGPCIAAMPHLTELQKQHPEAIFVSVAASESGKDETAKLAKVKEFVAGKGDGMGYRVVYAGDRAKMSEPWMRAAGQNGIPCAFIVDKDSKVAWIGHPTAMDEPLAQVVAGTWDIESARKAFADEQAAELAQREIAMAMRAARASGDYAQVVGLLKSALAKTPSDALKMQLVQILAGPANQPAEAWKYGAELYEANKSSAPMMNALAWMIVDPEGDVKEPNLDLAMKAAEAACAATKHEEGAMLDTLARVVFLKGDVSRAIELQKKALEKTPDGRMKESMQATLKEYEGKLKKA